jgi:tetratricopeptide (TPR) repeat protein
MDADLAGQLHDADLTAMGIRIRNARLACGMTQGQLADGDVTVGYISRIEAGQRRPDLKLLHALATRVGRPARELVTGIAADRYEQYQLALRTAEYALESGNGAEALDLTNKLLAATDSTAMPSFELEARYLRARALEVSGQFNEAIIELETVCASEHSARWLAGLIALSRCYRESSDFARAIEVGERVRERLAELGLEDSDEAIQLEVTVTFAHFARGDIEHAVRLSRQTIERADRQGSPVARASAYWNASIYESTRGLPAAAIPLAQRALALLGEGEDSRNLARLRSQLGRMLLRLDPPEVLEAGNLLRRAGVELRASSASVVDVARCDLELARVHLTSGEFAQAAALADAAKTSVHGSSPAMEADALTVLGQIAHDEGDPQRAAELYRTAVAILTSVGADRDAAQSWLELGALLEQVGDDDAARAAYRSAAVATGLQIPRELQVRV